jgi:hypothetical protein
MGYVDSALELSLSQDLTAEAASTNYLDLKASVPDIGTGAPLYLVLVVLSAFTDAASNSSVSVYLEGDASTSFSPDQSDLLFVIPALAAAGSKYTVALSQAQSALQCRFVRLKYVPANMFRRMET